MALAPGESSSFRLAVVLFVILSASALLVPTGVAIRSGSQSFGEPSPESRSAESSAASTRAAVPPATTWNWVNATLPTAPTPRAGAAMVYDAADGYTLLFGGCPSWGGDYWTNNCTAVGDTWKLANGVWTNITSSLSGPSPPPRADAGIAYDSVDRAVVMFGGFDGFTVYGDTWTYAAGHWNHVHPASSPVARFSPGMAGDSAGGVILFGGANSTLNSIAYNDTWSYVGGAWTRLSTPVAPPPRFAVGMAYDPVGGFVLLYGGFSGAVGSFADTWSFAGGVWTELSAASAPPAENYPSMAFDSQADSMIMTGGHNGYDVYAATWSYNSSTGWQMVSTRAYPTPSWGLSLSYDPSTGGVWLFGGYNATLAPYGVYLDSTWEFVLVTPDVYSVTFAQAGLPHGTPWTVTLGSARNTTTGTANLFQVENGSYRYTVANVSGYAVNPSSGLVVIAGGGAAIEVVFTSNSTSSTSFSWVTFSEGALVGAVVAGAIVAGVFLFRSKPPPSVPPPALGK